MENIQQIVNSLIDEKAKENNTIDLNAYAIGALDALEKSNYTEMLEMLIKCIYILDVKCTDGCVNKTWIDFQNGNGEDIGIEIDRFIKESKQLIKEATEL